MYNIAKYNMASNKDAYVYTDLINIPVSCAYKICICEFNAIIHPSSSLYNINTE